MGIFCCEFVIGFGLKIFFFKKNEIVYMIRFFLVGGFVCMVGEDLEMIEVKFGYMVGFLFNKED